ncbi:MAG: metal ABC transporter permease [Chloroflexi bacterium]|nr:metal ABC transporter permease [Chloroflexota bacterium]MCI0578504.1 metal ABC transporter permease [Chloroflexota bacterium]MCI0648479.1 metal ABC transporter permease [Chloroflexota bacterium]MCI0726003.1 metal ABC transporter permease [Chloroflexota bacterium]
MMDWLLEPLSYSFIFRGLLAAVVVGVVCSVLGTYVVLRGMAFFGDALAHTILPGVVVAFLLGWPLALGALIMGTLTAVGIGALSSQGIVKEDTAIGVIFAGAFALGVALLSATGNYTIDLAHFLFGNLLGVSKADLWLIFGLGGGVLLVVLLFYKEFLVISFDPILASTLRLPATFLRYLLLVLTAVTIVVALQVVGLALMVAMLVTPAAAASLLTRRVPAMMAGAAAIGAFSGVAGLYVSYYLNIASGPAVVLVATLIFLAAFLFAPGRGVITRLQLNGPAGS